MEVSSGLLLSSALFNILINDLDNKKYDFQI